MPGKGKLFALYMFLSNYVKYKQYHNCMKFSIEEKIDRQSNWHILVVNILKLVHLIPKYSTCMEAMRTIYWTWSYGKELNNGITDYLNFAFRLVIRILIKNSPHVTLHENLFTFN